MDFREKNTKVIATLSGMNSSVDFIRDLYERGVDVVRINTAFGSKEEFSKIIKNVREVSNRIPIIIDTKGPEIRTFMDKTISVKRGDKIKVSDHKGKGQVKVSCEGFVKDVGKGSDILINDGDVSLRVEKKDKDFLYCVVQDGGRIADKKSVNVPGVHLRLPSLTEKDKDFIEFAIEEDLEFIAHSFVRNKKDVQDLQKILDKNKSKIKILAKIENREGVDNFDEILNEVHGVMVARGDLGVEIHASEVPLIQKDIIERCVRAAKPVIVATHMLESMIEHSRATRAEISDIANAILDGTSAIMLSAETAIGKHPLKAVETMSKVALHLRSKKMKTNPFGIEPEEKSVRGYLAKAAVDLALNFDARAIIAPSHTGRTARIVSAMRSRKPIYALCSDPIVVRQLGLSHGIRASIMKKHETTDEMIHGCVSSLVSEGVISNDDVVVVVAGSPTASSHKSNFLEISKVSDLLSEHKGHDDKA